MPQKETVIDDGDIVIEKITTTSDDFQPVTFKRLREDIRKQEGDTESSCWGCQHSFGNPSADSLTQRLFRIFEDNIPNIPEDQVFAEIMYAQQELFVNVDPARNKLWTVASIRNHVYNHIIHPRFNSARDFRSFQQMQRVMEDTLFKRDDVTGHCDVDPKKVDALIKVNKSKNEALKMLLQADNAAE